MDSVENKNHIAYTEVRLLERAKNECVTEHLYMLVCMVGRLPTSFRKSRRSEKLGNSKQIFPSWNTADKYLQKSVITYKKLEPPKLALTNGWINSRLQLKQTL